MEYEDEYTLLACPHCGGRADIWTSPSKSLTLEGHFIYIECDICGSRTKSFFSKDKWGSIATEKAVKLWNSRIN